MRTKSFGTGLLISVLFCQALPGSYALAQSSGEKIRLIREEIVKRESVDVPDDLKQLNQIKLIERRAELRTLLRNEVDKLQRYKSVLGASITAQENERIRASAELYELEIKKLTAGAVESDIAENSSQSSSGSAIASDSGPVTPSGSVASQPGEGEARAVGSLSVGNPSTGNRVVNVVNGNSATAPTVPQQPSVFPLATTNEETSPTTGPVNCNEINTAGGQVKAFSQLDVTICGLVKDNLERRRLAVNPVKILNISSTDFFNLVVIMIAKKQAPSYLVEAEETRLDKQIGGAPSNAGSTSLVVKGGVPAILGFAVENGGLSQTINGTAVTFRGNPVGLLNALQNKGFIPSVKADEEDPVLQFLKKTSFAFTFNTDRGNQPGVLTATKQQLSSFSTRIEIINKRKPELYLRDWENFLVNRAQPFANSLNSSTTQLTDRTKGPVVEWRDRALQIWFDKTNEALSAAPDSDVEAVLKERLDKLPINDLSEDTILQLNGIERELGVYLNGRDQVLNKINSGTVLTFEYLNKREVNAPDTSNFNLIAEKGTGGGRVDFTFNASLTMFNNFNALKNFVNLNPTLPAPRRLRDFQFAGQIDVPFGSVRDFGQFVLFAGGRYERLLENATTDLGAILPNTKGDIGHFQLGVKVPIKGTGFKIPFSVTFANRTELVKEKSVRGNFGFTLDLDTLLARFKPF